MLVEICCGSYADIEKAVRAKAHRVELNSALYLGGLTPSLSDLKRAKRDFDIPIICMVRNRPAGFSYQKDDRETMLADAHLLLEAGADGLAFGFLNDDRTMDFGFTKAMVDLAHSYQKEAVVHKAFDICQDPFKTLDNLIQLGVDRVLTSGQAPTASQGIELLASMQKEVGSKIELLIGGGVRANNVVYLVKKTGIYQVHTSAKALALDPTTSYGGVSYSYNGQDGYEVVDQDLVFDLMEALRKEGLLC